MSRVAKQREGICPGWIKEGMGFVRGGKPRDLSKRGWVRSPIIRNYR